MEVTLAGVVAGRSPLPQTLHWSEELGSPAPAFRKERRLRLHLLLIKSVALPLSLSSDLLSSSSCSSSSASQILTRLLPQSQPLTPLALVLFPVLLHLFQTAAPLVIAIHLPPAPVTQISICRVAEFILQTRSIAQLADGFPSR